MSFGKNISHRDSGQANKTNGLQLPSFQKPEKRLNSVTFVI